MPTLRPYQQQAVDAVWSHLRSRDDNPCVVLPTGTGKSLVLGKLAGDAVKEWGGRVLILAHVKELLEQNAEKVRRLFPDVPVGIYSAGLKSRDTSESVIVAGIQSVHSRADQLGRFDLVLVDEAHTIPPDGDGMYREFFADMKVINPHVRLVGLTATPYRLRGGAVCKPENLLNCICYEAGIKEMIAQGYLSPLVSKAGRVEASLGGLHVRGGEFIDAEVEAAMDRDEITDAACLEIAKLTADRKSVLVFTTSVKHCEHVMKRLESCTHQACAMLTGATPSAERADVLARFKGERVQADLFGGVKPPLKYLVNVNVLTTGFDAPNTDCVVLLRPTASPGLLVQMVGRGTRLCEGKKDCLVLDYGQNILRHGPIDMIRIKDSSSGHGEAPAKKCPECLALIHAGYSVCPQCGYVFPPPNCDNMSSKAGRDGILSGEKTITEYEVGRTVYSVHKKYDWEEGDPLTMQVDYQVGFNKYKSEWVCPEHSGYARDKFIRWWRERSDLDVPDSASLAVILASAGALAEPTHIKVCHVSGERFERVCGWKLGEKPRREPGDDSYEISNDDNFDWNNNSPASIGFTDGDCPF